MSIVKGLNKMRIKEDNTYNDIREKAVEQWLDDMSRHSDVAVRGGVRATEDYVAGLKAQIAALEKKGELKDKYLRQMKEEQ